MERQVLTVVEVAKAIGLSRNATYEAIRRGDIPSLRIGRRIVVPRTAFEDFLRIEATGGDP